MTNREIVKEAKKLLSKSFLELERERQRERLISKWTNFLKDGHDKEIEIIESLPEKANLNGPLVESGETGI